MKVIEFIKRNISVFNVVGFFLFFDLINIRNKSTESIDIIIDIIIALLFFLFDFLTKKCIYSRLRLNLFQFLVLLTISLLIYYQIYQLCQD